MKKFRLLTADEIECRVAQCSEKGVSLLLYKTARTDADLLDETVGPENWENDFKLVDGVLYGGIGIRYGDQMVWKWDAGTESNTEAEKGRASDAFKRAGFKHGIGRELYSAPFIWIPADKCNIKQGKNGKPQCNDDFVVKTIDYDTREHINKLEITVRGNQVFSMGNKTSPPPKSNPKPLPSPPPEDLCETCGSTILPYLGPNGKEVSVAKHIVGSFERYNKKLCINCIMRMQAARAQLEANEN